MYRDHHPALAQKRTQMDVSFSDTLSHPVSRQDRALIHCHSNISMTMDTYSHVLPLMHKDAMDNWDDAFGVM